MCLGFSDGTLSGHTETVFSGWDHVISNKQAAETLQKNLLTRLRELKADAINVRVLEEGRGGWGDEKDSERDSERQRKLGLPPKFANLCIHLSFMQHEAEADLEQKCKVYSVRFLTNFLVLALLGGVLYLVNYLADVSLCVPLLPATAAI